MRADITKAFIFCMLLASQATAKEVAAGPLGAAYQVMPSNPSSHTRAAPWVLSASPQGSASAQRALFDPIAHYLAAVTGHAVIYRRAGNGLSFSHNLAAGRYDLVFGGPHLAAWADRHEGAHPLVRLFGRMAFDTVVRSLRIRTLAALVGRPVCANPPPGFASVTLLRHFPDVLRQPYLIAVSGWRQAYHGLLRGSCQAAVLPAQAARRLMTPGDGLYVIHQSRGYPGYGLVAGKNMPRAVRHLIRMALLARQGRRVTMPLARAEGVSAHGWVVAHRKDYAGLQKLLRRVPFLGG